MFGFGIMSFGLPTGIYESFLEVTWKALVMIKIMACAILLARIAQIVKRKDYNIACLQP